MLKRLQLIDLLETSAFQKAQNTNMYAKLQIAHILLYEWTNQMCYTTIIEWNQNETSLISDTQSLEQTVWLEWSVFMHHT